MEREIRDKLIDLQQKYVESILHLADHYEVDRDKFIKGAVGSLCMLVNRATFVEYDL